MLALRPITYRAACAYVDAHHRHHKKPQGHKFSIAATSLGRIVGVVMTGLSIDQNV